MNLLNKIENFLKILLHKKIIRDYNPCGVKTDKHALFYYVSSWYYPFFLPGPPKGSPIYEAMSMVQIINRNGYIVDIIDRNVESVNLTRKYHLFFGVVNGGSGRHFSNIMKQLDPETIKIAYSAGPYNEFTLKKYNERIEYFKERKKIDFVPGLPRICDINHDEYIAKTDAIFYCGYKIVPQSYSQFNVDKYRIIVPKSDDIICNHYDIINNKFKYKNSFLYYSGGGMLHKGLDILLDIFSVRDDIQLHICSTSKEKNFIDFYHDELFNRPNIHFHGNVKEDSAQMQNITNQCGFVISTSCADGDPAGPLVCMRYGLIPVITRETDISYDNAIFIEDYHIEVVEQTINKAINLTEDEFNFLVKKSLLQNIENSTCMLNYSFEKSLISVLNKKNS